MDPISMFKKHPYCKKREISGKLIAILDAFLEKRSINLIESISRVIKKQDIHELITTDELDVKPGRTVNRIAYIGFFEVMEGGVLLVGDSVFIKNELIGKVVGFDNTHIPNHQNIILFTPKRKTGLELGLNLKDEILITREFDIE